MLFFPFLITDLHFLISTVTAQFFNPTKELAIPVGTITNKANAKIESEPLTAELKIRKFSKYLCS